jgi:glutamate synthase (NADPH/NADH) large chain
VVVLGPTGRNFAAGMSGGIAYVYDTQGLFKQRCNLDQVDLETLTDADQVDLKRLLENHVKLTESPVAKSIVDDWAKEVRWFIKVMPTDYRNALARMKEIEDAAKRLSQRQTAGA